MNDCHLCRLYNLPNLCLGGDKLLNCLWTCSSWITLKLKKGEVCSLPFRNSNNHSLCSDFKSGWSLPLVRLCVPGDRWRCTPAAEEWDDDEVPGTEAGACAQTVLPHRQAPTEPTVIRWRRARRAFSLDGVTLFNRLFRKIFSRLHPSVVVHDQRRFLYVFRTFFVRHWFVVCFSDTWNNIHYWGPVCIFVLQVSEWILVKSPPGQMAATNMWPGIANAFVFLTIQLLSQFLIEQNTKSNCICPYLTTTFELLFSVKLVVLPVACCTVIFDFLVFKIGLRGFYLWNPNWTKICLLSFIK